MTPALERLKSLYVENLYFKELTPEDLRFVFECLGSRQTTLISGAAAILATQPREVIVELLRRFKTYSLTTQKVLCLNLMVSDLNEPYWYLITYLEDIQNRQFAEYVCICLGKTEYNILPIILSKLKTENKRYLSDLKTILYRIGFLRLEPLLAMFPVLPHEQVLRDVFGDKKIDRLKAA